MGISRPARHPEPRSRELGGRGRAASCRGVNACLSPQCLRGSRLNAAGGGAVKTALGWCRRLSVLLLLLLRLLLLLIGLEAMCLVLVLLQVV